MEQEGEEDECIVTKVATKIDNKIDEKPKSIVTHIGKNDLTKNLLEKKKDFPQYFSESNTKF